MDNKKEDNDIKKLSKPITLSESSGGWVESLWKKIAGDDKKIHITQKVKTHPSSTIGEHGSVTDQDQGEKEKTDGDIRKKEKSKEKKDASPHNFLDSKSEVKKAKSEGAEDFFSAAKEENKAEKESWLKPPPPKEKKAEIVAMGPTSFSWLIFGALTLLIIVVLVFASFGLINLVRNSYENQELGDIEQAIEQATDFYNKQEYEPAKYKIEEVLSVDSENKEAKELLDKINQKRGEIILGEFMLYKEADITLTAENTYLDPQNHYSIFQDPDWSTLDSDYDIKFTNHDATYGVKKYPGVNSLKNLEETYLESNSDQNNTVLTSKENISFKENNSKVIVSENQHYYIVSVLMHKYYFGYEISGWIPKTKTTDSLEDLKKFAQSFTLLPEFDLISYEKLPTFSIDNNYFHYWDGKIDQDNQDYISNQFVASISLINQTLLTNWDERLDIYLYPNFATLYTYTLSDNSFSDYNQKQIHIVYENQEAHQSFGYETTKVIFQSTFGSVKERYLMEGLAVYLDQTGRDYLELLRANRFIPLSELSSINWQIKSGDIKYFEVGVFAEYMIDKYGVDLYVNLTREDEFPEAYERIYDKSVDEIESEMKVELGLR